MYSNNKLWQEFQDIHFLSNMSLCIGHRLETQGNVAQGQNILVFSNTYRQAVVLSSWVKQPGHEADYSLKFVVLIHARYQTQC